MKRSCDVHPSYSPSRPPRQDCESCWAAYGRKQAVDAGLRSVGAAGRGCKTAKSRSRASRAKGREFAGHIAKLLQNALQLEEGDVYVKATSQIGCDLHLSPAGLRVFPYSIEAKCQEALNIWAALKQAADNATEDRPPILFFKRASTETYVAMSFTTFVRSLWRNPVNVLQDQPPLTR